MIYDFRLKILVILFFLSVVTQVHAATLFIVPPSSEITVEEKLTVDLKIDSEGQSLNAAQAVIRFPKDTLEVVSLDKTDSSLSFWLEEPNFSNADGIISFIGGTPYGVSGGSIQILKIVFLTKGSGSGVIILSDAAIIASDGSGTNILSKIVDSSFTVVAKKETLIIPQSQQVIPQPQQIVREAVPTGKLPIKPVLKVPLYSDYTKWFNFISQFNASWDLPFDVSGVSTALNREPNFAPIKLEGLFDNKTFAALSDGVWYLHVRFQNNVGWGPTTHYKIAVDTQPPLGFEVDIFEGEKTDNPAPTLQFQSSDALSGLKEYQIRVGDGDFIRISAADFTGSFKLSLQAPGKRRVVVKAIDQAENSIENSVDIEIIPIGSPIITFVPIELYPEDEQGLVAKGTALPDVNVLLKVQKILSSGRGEVVAEGIVRTDDRGNWEFTFDNQPLRNGRYIILAQSQDARGALSLMVESSKIQVKSRPIIQIGKFQLGMEGALIFLLVVIVGGFSGGVWFGKKRQEKLALRVLVVKADMAKVFKLIQDDIVKLQQAIKTPTEADDKFIIERLWENIKKMEGYLKKEIEKLK